MQYRQLLTDSQDTYTQHKQTDGPASFIRGLDGWMRWSGTVICTRCITHVRHAVSALAWLLDPVDPEDDRQHFRLVLGHLHILFCYTSLSGGMLGMW